MVKINLNIHKKDLWFLSAIMIFLIAIGYVVAYNPTGAGNPAVMGHSYNELQTCPEGKILKISGGVWTCADDNSGAGGGVTSLSAGTGITLSPNPITSTGTISADTAYLQRRVSNSCAVGSSIKSISSTGLAICATNAISTSAVCVTGSPSVSAPTCSCSGSTVSNTGSVPSCTVTADSGSCSASGCSGCINPYRAACCVCAP